MDLNGAFDPSFRYPNQPDGDRKRGVLKEGWQVQRLKRSPKPLKIKKSPAILRLSLLLFSGVRVGLPPLMPEPFSCPQLRRYRLYRPCHTSGQSTPSRQEPRLGQYDDDGFSHLI
jgi:hypothetical protein